MLLDSDVRRTPRRLVIAIAAVFLFFSFAALVRDQGVREHVSSYYPALSLSSWTFDYERDELKYGLSDEQCDAAFPKLYREIDRALHFRLASGRNVSSSDLDRNMAQNGMIRAMVYDGKLYIIQALDEPKPVFHERTVAALHSLNRAITSAQNPKDLPNVEFIMLMEDTAHTGATDLPADRILWTYARKSSDRNIWLIPEYGKWTELGPPEDVRRKMDEIELDIGDAGSKLGPDLFDAKVKKLLWRGVLWTNIPIREALLNVTAHKPWADALEVGPTTTYNHVPIAEQCKWQFLAYTEGISNSGRLKYLQNCRSVIVSHELEYLTPWLALLEPEGPDQNVVMVKRDWSDLDEKMHQLLRDPDLSRTIADNSVKSFKERYLTGAAEACYWRRMLRSWSHVSFEPDPYELDKETGQRKWRGTAFETFTMPGRFHYQQVSH